MDKYTNILCVKSILTIVLSLAFAVLCFIYPEDFTDTMKMVIVSVITFYFSHQTDKKHAQKSKEDSYEITSGDGNQQSVLQGSTPS